ncbi:MAG: MBL fold metallo-hydrolase [Acidobacteria bacterium]|nr:MBL fold metallo-hydrolase [Acidobacteriota bacterium]
MKLCVLSSGSSANSIFVSAGRTKLLIDAGLSRREIMNRLTAIGERAEALDAVLITHEHTDHISGLAPLVRKINIPVYMTHRTAPAVAWEDFTPKLHTFQAGTRLSLGDFEIDTFTVPHDAADPVGYCLHAEGLKTGIVTDLGYVPDSIRYHLRETHLLVLESNHDLEMLKVGPYPWWVKQRVMGRHGHLSNEMASDFIRQDMAASTAALVLAHLSAHNNHPELARLVGAQALNQRGLPTRLVVAEHGQQTEVIEL